MHRWARQSAGPIILGAAVAALVSLSAPGCKSDFQNENDELRARIAELEQQLQTATRQAEERDAQLRRLADEYSGVSEAVILNTPQLAEITIGRLSHVRDVDDDGAPDLATVYVNSVDARGRPVQIVGEISVTIRAAARQAESDASANQQDIYEPQHTLGSTTLDPPAVREAYRAAFTGTHYTIDLPIEWPAETTFPAVHITVTFRDGYTDKTYIARRFIELRDDTTENPAG